MLGSGVDFATLHLVPIDGPTAATEAAFNETSARTQHSNVCESDICDNFRMSVDELISL